MAKQFLYRNYSNIVKQYGSALYITGDKAQNTFSVLTPHLDFEDRMKSKNLLAENIKLRKLRINLDKIEKQWHFYKSIEETKRALELSKTEIGTQISQLVKENAKNEKKIEKLKMHIALIKNDLKNVKDYLFDLEEHTACTVLSLPNILHPKTPHENEILIHSYSEKPAHLAQSHIDIGKEQNLIEIVNPVTCYLKNEAALFEMCVLNYIGSSLLDQNFIKFANSDFTRSVVIEGCGTDFKDDTEILTLQDKQEDKCHELSHLHLSGSTSIYSFMSYFTKHLIQPSFFPLKLFSTGRTYKPTKSNELSLFNLLQESGIEIFLATFDDDENMNCLLQEIIRVIIELYEKLGYHFQIVYLPAVQLKNNEALRVSVQMFSNHLQAYTEIGNVSVYDHFLSKRLLFTYNEGGERKYPKVICGSLSAQKLLACVLENNSTKNKNLIDSLLKQYLP